jgi:hypothetical protein
MSTVTESDFTQRPAEALRIAKTDGEVRIEYTDGTALTLSVTRPSSETTKPGRSPLDVGYVKGLHLTVEEIVSAIREGRERDYLTADERAAADATKEQTPE